MENVKIGTLVRSTVSGRYYTYNSLTDMDMAICISREDGDLYRVPMRDLEVVND